MTTDPIDPTDPPSQAEGDGERIEQFEEDVDGAREQVERHDDADGPAFIDEGSEHTDVEDDAIAP